HRDRTIAGSRPLRVMTPPRTNPNRSRCGTIARWAATNRASRTGSILTAAVATAAPTPSPRATAPGPPSSPTADHDAAPSRATAASSYHHLAMMISGCGRRRSGGKNLRTSAAVTGLSTPGHSTSSTPLYSHGPLVGSMSFHLLPAHQRRAGERVARCCRTARRPLRRSRGLAHLELQRRKRCSGLTHRLRRFPLSRHRVPRTGTAGSRERRPDDHPPPWPGRPNAWMHSHVRGRLLCILLGKLPHRKWRSCYRLDPCIGSIGSVEAAHDGGADTTHRP